ncbi:transcriptional regulatory protein AlgP [Jatropha curcas]|uniref:transcriptional regulatory protein AlgP n=1 Tax=Jatropha curcas TaxID=180498 RepID=UPI00189619E7|nr:transcriptional regulatory protein AlgP [Jatropha curcas]
MKSADSLKIEESKPQGQGATSRKTACPNPPAQKPAANRPPHAENAAAVQAEQGKSSVGNQMTQAKRKPESPGRSGEIPELMKSVDSLKVEESKPQGQQATSGKTAPANPLAEKPAANCPPRAENAAAVLAKEGKSTVRNQMMQAKRKPESPGRSGEIPELTKSVDSLKVEESKPQGQEATSGKTAPANPLAEKPAANRPPRAENAAAVLAKEGKSTVRNQMTQAKRKPESPGRSGEIPELMKSVDSLTVKESKPQGQEATSGKTAPANPPAEKPAANRPPHAENAAAVLAKQGKSSVANQMMQAKWKPESPGRSCENPELTRSVDSLKVEESKPQEQEATSGRTAPANPPAVKPAANHPPHDENAAAARAKLVGGSTTKQKSEALRKRDKEKRMKQKKRQQQKAATKGKLAAAVAAADTEEEKQEKQGEEEETKGEAGAVAAATKGKPAAAVDTAAIAAAAAAAATAAAAAATAAAALSAIAATAKGS